MSGHKIETPIHYSGVSFYIRLSCTVQTELCVLYEHTCGRQMTGLHLNATQVHFVPDTGTVAQIVYTDDQVLPPQQVVYTADSASYKSVDDPEHTLVYIHPVEATQTLFTDPGQVTYVQ
ncbi:PR domain zinc finger protein 10 [Saguinus oedipus]|uniref:PR domain zinc finger protein 10 n=1 Tax=Saguinus oedipus TaxID=9490 RepID=A0ABQ9W4C3_SAGOE|nr:PR domain zinc finger protein 10 [Saguinus oedipus]